MVSAGRRCDGDGRGCVSESVDDCALSLSLSSADRDREGEEACQRRCLLFAVCCLLVPSAVCRLPSAVCRLPCRSD